MGRDLVLLGVFRGMTHLRVIMTEKVHQHPIPRGPKWAILGTLGDQTLTGSGRYLISGVSGGYHPGGPDQGQGKVIPLVDHWSMLCTHPGMGLMAQIAKMSRSRITTFGDKD